jgi:hypothetical protein
LGTAPEPDVAHDEAVASAANATTPELLLRLLASAGWGVTLERSSRGYFALAVHGNGGSPLRITASAKSRDAAVLLIFEQAWARLDTRRARVG